MKWSELDEAGRQRLARNRPDWMAYNRPVWMAARPCQF